MNQTSMHIKSKYLQIHKLECPQKMYFNEKYQILCPCKYLIPR